MPLRFLISKDDECAIGSVELEKIAAAYGDFLMPAQVSVEVSLISLQEMQAINKETRDLDEPTDVLSFPLYPDRAALLALPIEEDVLIGSIVISPEKATAYQETLPQLVHHGLLHICGFDHVTDIMTWQSQERPILKTLAEHGLIIPEVQGEA